MGLSESAEMAVPNLLEELAQLAQSELSPVQFYQELLGRLTTVAAASTGAAWTAAANSFVFLCQTGSSTDHSAQPAPESKFGLYRDILTAGTVRLVVPESSEDAPPQPNNRLLAICPVVDGDVQYAVIELEYSGGTSLADHEAIHRLLTIVGDLAVTFHRRQELSRLRKDQIWWRELDNFAQTVNGTLNLKTVAYTVANDGRRIVGCDRLTMLIRHGRSFRVMAISGLDQVNRRANSVRRLEQFATLQLALKDSFVYPCDEDQLAPNVKSALLASLHESNARRVLLVPLFDHTQKKEGAAEDQSPVIGGLIAENFTATGSDDLRLDAVSKHAARALTNAHEYHSVFLVSVWSAVGRMKWLVSLRALPRTTSIVLLIAAIILALIFVQTEFELVAEGTLQPETQRSIFAPQDGVIDDLAVRHGSHVDAKTKLLTLRSADVDLKLEEIDGELQTTIAKIASIKATLADATGADLTRTRINSLAGEQEELKTWQSSLVEQKALLIDRKRSLTVHSPITGEVITANVRELLEARPVSRGQNLMTVADLSGQWILKLHLPDRSVGHLSQARSEFGDELPVDYIISTRAETTLRGTTQTYNNATTLDEGQSELGLSLTVAIDEDQVPLLVPGARVVAKIACGKRSLGFVWFHDIVEFVRLKIFF